MNTTHTAAPNPGYYVPTPADCEEAGLYVGENQLEEPVAYWGVGEQVDEEHYKVHGDRIVFAHGQPVVFESQHDPSASRELTFTNRNACMAFLRNHMVTAAEQGGLN